MRRLVLMAGLLAMAASARAADPGGVVTITTGAGQESFRAAGPAGATAYTTTRQPLSAPSAYASPPPPPPVVMRMPDGSLWRPGAGTVAPAGLAPSGTHLPVLTLIGQPTVADGAVPLGEALVQAKARPTLTGRLTRPMQSSGEKELFRGRDVPAGSPVYATQLGGALAWCAPGFNNGVWLSSTGTYCALKSGGSWMSLSARESPFVTQASIFLNIGTIDPPLVALQPVEFNAPFRVGYVVTRWTAGRAVVERRILWDGKPYPYGCSFDAARAEDGSAALVAFGMRYRLSPDGEGQATRIALVGPATAADRALDAGGECPAARPGASFIATTYVRRTVVSHGRH